MGVEYIKCIHFDLDTQALLKHFPKGTAKPYALIKDFFEKNGFEHRQYSGYISKKPINNITLFKIMTQLGKEFIWIKDCIQKFDASNAPVQMDMSQIIIKAIDIKLNKITQQFNKKLRDYQKKKNILSSETRAKIHKELMKLYQILKENNICLDEKQGKILNELNQNKDFISKKH